MSTIPEENANTSEMYLQQRAYYLWLEDGMPPDQGDRYWRQAVAEAAAKSRKVRLAAASNVALNQPANQSSFSPHSTVFDTKLDAAVANNGDTTSPTVFHTSAETNPWWEVDLEGKFFIDQVVLYNRFVECQDRLSKFSILGSMDGADWQVIYTKDDETIFDVYAADIQKECVARFIRIRLDRYEYLHFRECQVFGRPANID